MIEYNCLVKNINKFSVEEYLREYAQFRRIKPEELYEVLDELQEAARSFDTFDAWYVHMEEYKEALQKKSSEQKEEAKAVVFRRLLSAKAVEFRVVFLVDAVEGNMPHRKAVMDVDIQEERRDAMDSEASRMGN